MLSSNFGTFSLFDKKYGGPSIPNTYPKRLIKVDDSLMSDDEGGKGVRQFGAAGCAKERMLLVLEVAVLLLALVVAPERNRTLKKTRRQSSRTQQKFSSCCYQARKQVYNNQPRFIPLKWAAKSAIPLVVVVALLVFTTRRFSSWVSTFQER